MQVFQSCWSHYLSNKEAESKNHFMASPEKLLVWVSRENAAGLLLSDFGKEYAQGSTGVYDELLIASCDYIQVKHLHSVRMARLRDGNGMECN